MFKNHCSLIFNKMKLILALALFAVAAHADVVPRNIEIPSWALFPRMSGMEYQELIKKQEFRPEHIADFKAGNHKQIASAGAMRGDPKIIGGAKAVSGQFPWQVAVSMDSSYFCSGSIISSTWVLTAAHCVDGITSFRLVFGSLTPNGGAAGTSAQTSRTSIMNSNYNPRTIANDIGLVQIPAALSWTSQIGPVRLPSKSQDSINLVGRTARISGWGLTSDSATSVSGDLMWVDLPIVDNSVCVATYGNVILDTNICVSGKNGKSTCSGDSGGPLVLQESDGLYTQVGIVSFGAAAGCELGYELGFTRVTSYLGWIETNTNIIINP